MVTGMNIDTIGARILFFLCSPRFLLGVSALPDVRIGAAVLPLPPVQFQNILCSLISCWPRCSSPRGFVLQPPGPLDASAPS